VWGVGTVSCAAVRAAAAAAGTKAGLGRRLRRQVLSIRVAEGARLSCEGSHLLAAVPAAAACPACEAPCVSEWQRAIDPARAATVLTTTRCCCSTGVVRPMRPAVAVAVLRLPIPRVRAASAAVL
jgi:hypothetical protein